MNKTLLLDKYPVFSTEIAKDATDCQSLDEVMARFRKQIEAHPVASYIGEFDHYAHVAKQAEGKIDASIKAAKHVMFCVANAIPNPMIGAARPRAISVTELADKFVISYLEAPVEQANQVMETWVGALKKSG